VTLSGVTCRRVSMRQRSSSAGTRTSSSPTTRTALARNPPWVRLPFARLPMPRQCNRDNTLPRSKARDVFDLARRHATNAPALTYSIPVASAALKSQCRTLSLYVEAKIVELELGDGP
jgi:hypothetical protein